MGGEESSLSPKIWGMGGLKKVLFLRRFGDWGVKRVLFLRKFRGWGFEESSLSSKVSNMETRRVYVLFYTLL